MTKTAFHRPNDSLSTTYRNSSRPALAPVAQASACRQATTRTATLLVQPRQRRTRACRRRWAPRSSAGSLSRRSGTRTARRTRNLRRLTDITASSTKAETTATTAMAAMPTTTDTIMPAPPPSERSRRRRSTASLLNPSLLRLSRSITPHCSPRPARTGSSNLYPLDAYPTSRLSLHYMLSTRPTLTLLPT